MRMKSVFLATTAVALLTGTGAAQAGDLYVSVFGGANFQTDNSGLNQTSSGNQFTTTRFNESPETGFVLGGAVGAHLDKWAQGLRTEVEVSFRRNSLGGDWNNHIDTTVSSSTVDTQNEHGPISGHVSNFSILANVWYDFDIGTKVKPYVGGGAGWARSRAEIVAPVTTSSGCCDLDGSNSRTQENSGFAWQLGAGFNYPVSPGVDLGIGYRYFRGPSFDPLFIGKNNTPVPVDNENHSVQVNLTIGIN